VTPHANQEEVHMKVGLKVLLSCAGLAMALGAPQGASAQDYPNRDIHFICAFPAGSGADVLVRYFAEQLRPIINRTIVVENKAGAGGNIATEYTARAKPDGYTIYVHAPSGLAANMHLFKNPPVDAGKAIQVAATINRQPFMVLVDAKSPYKNLADLTAAMKKKGAKATYATAAPTGAVMGEIYKNVTGVQAVEVNYKTAGDSVNELLSGKLDYGMHDPVFALAQAREGRMRILAVSTGKRLEASPDLPTMTEQGVPMDLTGWWGAMVPMATPRPVVDRINQWFSKVVGSPEAKKFLNSFGGDPFINSPDVAQQLFLKSIQDWGEYVKLAKIQPQ
jgi:tripartite-type tricarboxylate transporter receptor subunit TctC